jgi:hypothetical protein
VAWTISKSDISNSLFILDDKGTPILKIFGKEFGITRKRQKEIAKMIIDCANKKGEKDG